MTDGDEGDVLSADDGIHASQGLDALGVPDSPPEGRNGVRRHQIADSALSVELSLPVRKHQREGRFGDAALLRDRARRRLFA